MHELMFQAGVKGMSERSELIPCIIGASLSEPHIDELNVRNLYIYGGGGTSVTRAPPYTLYSNSRYIPVAA